MLGDGITRGLCWPCAAARGHPPQSDADAGRTAVREGWDSRAVAAANVRPLDDKRGTRPVADGR